MDSGMNLPPGWRLSRTADYAPTLWKDGRQVAYFPWHGSASGGRFRARRLPGRDVLMVRDSPDLEEVVKAAVRILTSPADRRMQEWRAANAREWSGRLEAAGVEVSPEEVYLRYEDVYDWIEGALDLLGPGGLLERNGWTQKESDGRNYRPQP